MSHKEISQQVDVTQRPRPQLTLDTAWWHRALRRHQLQIQRCIPCGRLRHPVQPMCPHCRSLDWDTICAAGTGSVHSFVVTHHPRIPGFDYPLTIALIDLAEGTRVLGNIVGIAPDSVVIGMAVSMEFVDIDEERSVPQFRPAPRQPADGGGS